MEKNYNQLISKTTDPDTFIKYLKFNNLMEEIKKNTKVKYIVKEIESEIYDDNFDDFDIEYICTVEATLYEKYVCTYEDRIRENGVTIAKEQGEILTENNPAIDHDIEEMICSTYLAREAIIEKLNITEEKMQEFYDAYAIKEIKRKLNGKKSEITETLEKRKEIDKKLQTLRCQKKGLLKELRDLLETQKKSKEKKIGTIDNR